MAKVYEKKSLLCKHEKTLIFSHSNNSKCKFEYILRNRTGWLCDSFYLYNDNSELILDFTTITVEYNEDIKQLCYSLKGKNELPNFLENYYNRYGIFYVSDWVSYGEGLFLNINPDSQTYNLVMVLIHTRDTNDIQLYNKHDIDKINEDVKNINNISDYINIGNRLSLLIDNCIIKIQPVISAYI